MLVPNCEAQYSEYGVIRCVVDGRVCAYCFKNSNLENCDLLRNYVRPRKDLYKKLAEGKRREIGDKFNE